MTDLNAIAREHLRAAESSDHGRSAVLVAQDGPLRQTVLALAAGAVMGEHNAPHAATLYVLEGSITVVSASGRLVLNAGELAVVPKERHSVEASEDSVFLLTAVTEVP
ncbi:cupin domain-containing protein [Arthrobacter sp. 35W]|uniref:cupin domain-containing protein n=1 Tax=Arthrobacter sp. 35W TaxID=1132441 RepID=UPI00041F151C|nr:cupin domain-containing protein [Arthrobacter sp. 35W]